MPWRKAVSMCGQVSTSCLRKPPRRRNAGIEDRADPQPSAHFVTQRLRRPLHVVRRGERAFGVGQQRLAVAREREPVRGPREQRHAERLLQMLDLQADGGLGQVKLHRGTREIALACDGDECPEQSQIHILILAAPYSAVEHYSLDLSTRSAVRFTFSIGFITPRAPGRKTSQERGHHERDISGRNPAQRDQRACADPFHQRHDARWHERPLRRRLQSRARQR